VARDIRRGCFVDEQTAPASEVFGAVDGAQQLPQPVPQAVNGSPRATESSQRAQEGRVAGNGQLVHQLGVVAKDRSIGERRTCERASASCRTNRS
jgi:hypothetical protein